jgi:hypothetical protein
MKRAALPLFCLAVVSAVVACSDGEPAAVTADEPITVSGSQFISGDLPGTPPSNTSGDGGASPAPLSVSSVNYTNLTVIPGASGKSFDGVVTNDAVAVGVRLADLGSGYWVVPVSGPDPQVAGTDFSFKASFNANDPPGPHYLSVVALDANGNGGTQYDTQICMRWRIPDNGHSCNPSVAVPAVVISLQWDANFDVDLHVIDPSGTDINPKTNPLQFPVDAGQPPPTDPKVDRDSLGHCVPDGMRQEDLVFQNYPATGAYDIYADPFDACGQPAVRFVLTIYEAGSDGELHATFTQNGELLSNDVTGGGSSGLFIAEKQFN